MGYTKEIEGGRRRQVSAPLSIVLLCDWGERERPTFTQL